MGKPETFDFMGLTHICGTTRAGDYLLVRHTSRKRMAAKLRWVRDELMRRRHLSIKKQGLWLQRVVGGYFNYHAMPTNIEALGGLGEERLEVVLDHRIEWRGGRPAQSVDVPGLGPVACTARPETSPKPSAGTWERNLR